MVSDQLSLALERALDALSTAGIDHVLIGGMALNLWRRVRATRDLDILVLAESTDIDALRRSLRDAGFAHHAGGDTVRLDDALLLQFWWPIRALGMSLKLDVLSGRLPFHAQVLARKRSVTLHDRGVPVASPEDLILLKLIARRPIDLSDAEELYRLHRATLDEQYLLATAAKLGIRERLAQIADSTT
ncbi:MAG: nucleotidyl transferase AbiEii/AbiGii toxin family protein [Planctomycetota bacterium]